MRHRSGETVSVLLECKDLLCKVMQLNVWLNVIIYVTPENKARCVSLIRGLYSEKVACCRLRVTDVRTIGAAS